ncbi:MAG: 16S rRNA (guanine(527)-N(7))-methyltransferase RsmG [Candidatus Koribacter versatilis]|nr:16S rRNA (guanine(527)-N(7))-methyltransferase RsmG [Candidatus Koribacter versatilis]
MDSARIAALLHPFLERTLPEVPLRQISTYIDLLLRWNARINLTAVRHPDEIVTRHFGESLFLARHLFPGEKHVGTAAPGCPAERSSAAVLDIGSGAGFPGLPLKIWAPAISLTLVESNHKKAAFLREVIRALTLTDVNVITARAETLPGALPPADVVTLRAVERFDSILPVALRLLAPTGRLALLIGSAQLPTLATLAHTLRWQPPIPIPQSHSRVLSISVPQ